MPQTKKPISVQAVAALAVAFLALTLATVGAFDPWRFLHFPVNPSESHARFEVVAAIFYVTPIVLGIFAALFGGHSLKTIEQAQGQLTGDGPAFFAQMSGLFAAVIGACTTFVALVWPKLG
jgi:hypothetical protein